MRREVIFRGKSLVTNEWIYGDNTGLPDVSYISGAISPERRYTHDLYIVDPDTVGEYTGLRDKNGIRIFEGDIVEYSGGKYKVVFVGNPSAYFGLDMRAEYGEIWPFNYSVPANKMKVVGNIYDNDEEGAT